MQNIFIRLLQTAIIEFIKIEPRHVISNNFAVWQV